jgi:hypothetical protein
MLGRSRTQAEQKLNMAAPLLAYADDVNPLGDNSYANINTEIIIVASFC